MAWWVWMPVTYVKLWDFFLSFGCFRNIFPLCSEDHLRGPYKQANVEEKEIHPLPQRFHPWVHLVQKVLLFFWDVFSLSIRIRRWYGFSVVISWISWTWTEYAILLPSTDLSKEPIIAIPFSITKCAYSTCCISVLPHNVRASQS